MHQKSKQGLHNEVQDTEACRLAYVYFFSCNLLDCDCIAYVLMLCVFVCCMLLSKTDNTRCSAIAEKPRCMVRYIARSGRLELGDNILRTLYRSIFNHCDIIGLKICRIRRKNAK